MSAHPLTPAAARRLACACGLVAFLVYWSSILPTVGFIDAPRYTAFVAHLHLGVASIEHPLFVLAAKPFTWLPIGDLAYRVNLATAFYGAWAVGLSALIIARTTGSIYAAAIASLSFATSYDLWWLATEAEVYTLAVALLMAALVFAIARPRGQDPAVGRVAFFLGLAVVNHQAAIFTLPPIALFLWMQADAGSRPRLLLRATGAFGLGLSPYLCLLAWSVVSSGLAETLYAAAGGEFQSSFLAPIGLLGYARVLAFLVVITGYQFYPLHTLGWMAGAVFLWRRQPRRGGLLLAIAALNGLFVVLYDVPDRIYFYLPSFAMLALLLGEGLALLQRRLADRSSRLRFAILLLFALPVLGKMAHYQAAAEFIRRHMGGEERLFTEVLARSAGEFPIIMPRIPGRDNLAYYSNPNKRGIRAATHYRWVLENVPLGSLLVDDWYHGYAVMADYYQGVEQVRRDVEVIRWFQRWGGTPAEREACAARILQEIEKGRTVLLATSQYPSSTLVARIQAAGHSLEPWAGIEDLHRVKPRIP